MSDLQAFVSPTAQMTSREIALLVESRHDNTKRTIETLAKSGVIRLPQIEVFEEINNLGFSVKREQYVFAGPQGKRDSIVVVAQLSPEFTARLVDRWQELEAYYGDVSRTPIYSAPPPLLPSAIGRAMIDDMLYISRMLKVPDSYAIGIAASQAAQVTGLPWDRLLTQAAAMSDVPEEEMMLEPTELGKRFGGISARAMNLQLAALGLQSKATGSWEPTEAGKPMSIRHAWSDGPKTGYNLKWNVAAIAKLLQPSDSDEDR